MLDERVLVVSIDGVAPRFVTPRTMPHLCELAQQSASTFDARTVHPSITLPAHASMLRGIDPEVHGIFDNTPQPLSDDWPSFLQAAADADRTTAALLNWRPIDGLVEPSAAAQRFFLDGGYGGEDDARIARAGSAVLDSKPQVTFAYLVSPDNAGHDHGWGSPHYIDALGVSDRALGQLLHDAGPDTAVVVTTDHGGHGNDHTLSEPIDKITFMVVRSRRIHAGTWLPQASILDVAPTVADLAGFAAPDSWQGRSLVGTERALSDRLFELVQSMEAHHYGESVTMLEHSLLTAAQAEEAGASEELVVAALLHDIGHVLGEAGEWGLPDHAAVGAQFLQAHLPPAVVEPLRLHVDAKRYLVATDPAYGKVLSLASQQTLRQQGGPFTEAEYAVFEQSPWHRDAVALRRFDDQGKGSSTPPPLAHYSAILERVLRRAVVAHRSRRDACSCAECRDPGSGQHLITATELVEPDPSHVGFDTRPVSEQHRRLWGATLELRPAADIHEFISELASAGISLIDDVPARPGEVLSFARGIGFVRETNYGDLFDVMTVPNPNNLAYSALGLPLHTDNPYRDPVPTVQLLHCLQPAETGGGSRFVDGFYAAELLRVEQPEAFRTLVSTLCTFRFADAEVDLQAERPIIECDPEGRVRAINLNHRCMVPLPASARSEQFYHAYLAFDEVLTRDDLAVRTVLKTGQLVAFANRRVLHAREPFSGASTRHLQGCYIDIDAVESAARRQTSG